MLKILTLSAVLIAAGSVGAMVVPGFAQDTTVSSSSTDPMSSDDCDISSALPATGTATSSLALSAPVSCDPPAQGAAQGGATHLSDSSSSSS